MKKTASAEAAGCRIIRGQNLKKEILVNNPGGAWRVFFDDFIYGEPSGSAKERNEMHDQVDVNNSGGAA